MDSTEIIWSLNNDSSVILGIIKVERLSWTNLEVDSNGVTLGLNDLNCLREKRVTDKVLISLSRVNIIRHLHGFGSGSSLIKERGIGDWHLGDFHNGSLEVQK